jgi:hypothetical protein
MAGGRVNCGGLVSRTLTTILCEALPPCASSTVRVTECDPVPRVVFTLAPVSVPNGPDQLYVRVSPSGSVDADPSRVRRAPHSAGVGAATAIAVGARFAALSTHVSFRRPEASAPPKSIISEPLKARTVWRAVGRFTIAG